MNHVWKDLDNGTEYELRYDVPQGNSDERECVYWRVVGMNQWNELPPFATVPDEFVEEWFGVSPAKRDNRLEKPDVQTMRDLNSLFGALFRLTTDLKARGVIHDDMKAVIS
jgi:hypothetical protein